jgi:diketogulonate reductase-like aldo/keto reductase
LSIVVGLTLLIRTAWYKKKDDPYDKALIEATLTAVKLGYTHLDGAEVYNTEEVSLGAQFPVRAHLTYDTGAW